MSEIPSEQPSSPDEFDVGPGLYDGAALELLYVCREKFKKPESYDVTEQIIEQAVYLEPPAEDDEEDGEWERIDLYNYPAGYPDTDGSERLLRLEFNQFLTDDTEFIKRYTLSFKNGSYRMFKQFFLYDGDELDETLAWKPLSDEEAVAKTELNDLCSLVLLAPDG